MIKRLNFYDIYGYLLPGLFLLGLLWLPHGLADVESQPELNFLSVLLAVAAAYVVGQVLQTMAMRIFPSKVKAKGGYRHPSELILDDGTFPVSMRAELKKRIDRLFHLDIDTISDRRQAFFLCRELLIQRGAGSYAEQFQGMYALMRGLAAASAFAAPYQIGCTLGGFVSSSARVAALIAAVVATGWFLLMREPSEEASHRLRFACPLMLASLLAGGGMASAEITDRRRAILLLVSIATVLVARRAYGAYPTFARSFAETVYRDFFVLDPRVISSKTRTDDNEGLEILKEP